MQKRPLKCLNRNTTSTFRHKTIQAKTQGTTAYGSFLAQLLMYLPIFYTTTVCNFTFSVQSKIVSYQAYQLNLIPVLRIRSIKLKVLAE